MKYVLFSLIAWVTFSCTNTDQQSSVDKQKAIRDTANFTTIEWLDSTNQTIPKITQGEVVEITWKFKNSGDKPLVIADVHPGCGCTGAEGPSKPIAPGKQGVITAKFDSENYPGMQHKNVTVTANNSNKNSGSVDILQFAVEVAPKK
jgi:hypothetical protein